VRGINFCLAGVELFCDFMLDRLLKKSGKNINAKHFVMGDFNFTQAMFSSNLF
jgi:hypothetical protein